MVGGWVGLGLETSDLKRQTMPSQSILAVSVKEKLADPVILFQRGIWSSVYKDRIDEYPCAN